MARPKNPQRLKALEDGAKFYMGPVCQHGHSGERYTKTKACRKCVQMQGQTRGDRQPQRARRPRVSNDFEQLR
jgi:hypothetical protein